MSSGTAVAVALSATAGLAGAVQAAVMGELGERVGIVSAVGFSVIVVFLAGLVAVLVWERSFAGVQAALHEPAWLWIGGLLSLYIVFAVTIGPPRIGVTATIGLVIAGNLAMGALVDRYGLLGQEQVAITWPRVVGLLLLAIGAALSLDR
jgi:bacterial/archaeal transporter family-2 protein